MKEKDKSKTKHATTKTSKHKSSKIHKYEETFTEDEYEIISKNNLISNSNINKNSKETLLSSGLILKNVGGVIYFSYDPLGLSSIEISVKILHLFSTCLTNTLKLLYKKNKDVAQIIKKKFSRFTVFFDIETDLGGDVMFQMKLFKYLLNENVFVFFKEPVKNKIIKYFEALIELRNQIAHQVYKKDDYKIKILTKENYIKSYYKKHKIRNYNYIKSHIDMIQYILKQFYDVKYGEGYDINKKLFRRNYTGLTNMKHNLDNLCLIRDRRHKMLTMIKSKKQTHKLAENTLTFLNKKLSSKNKKTSQQTARNIVNLVTSRLTDDNVFIKEFNGQISNKKSREICKNM